MTKKTSHHKVFQYRDRDKASISVCLIQEPYGPGTESVVSVGCSLKGKPDEPSWVVHIPAYMAQDVAAALISTMVPDEPV
jgi:hypothetical protein